MALQDFVRDASRWMREEGPHGDIVISTRIRIARNLIEHPFPLLSNDTQAEAILEKVKAAIDSPAFRDQGGGHYEFLRLHDVAPVDLEALVEKYLISSNLVDSPPTGETKLTDWAREHAALLGIKYASELARRRDRTK
ncbi:MAG: hypothetical protein ACXVDJ_08500, partial [Tumebacillaceae bacterium]